MKRGVTMSPCTPPFPNELWEVGWGVSVLLIICNIYMFSSGLRSLSVCLFRTAQWLESIRNSQTNHVHNHVHQIQILLDFMGVRTFLKRILDRPSELSHILLHVTVLQQRGEYFLKSSRFSESEIFLFFLGNGVGYVIVSVIQWGSSKTIWKSSAIIILFRDVGGGGVGVERITYLGVGHLLTWIRRQGRGSGGAGQGRSPTYLARGGRIERTGWCSLHQNRMTRCL